MKITIKDIARLAGVSTTTVSKVINNKDESISQATRERITSLMKEYNYTPSTVARSLVTKKTNTIGLIIPDIRNPFFPELARGVEDRANSAGYNIIFCNTDNKIDKEDEYLRILAEKMVDGIIMAPSSKREDRLDKTKNYYVPVILVDRDIDIETDYVKGRVFTDNFKGAHDAVKYMINQGLTRILFISGPLTSKASIERLEGYKSALRESNIEYEAGCVLEGEFNETWGREAAIAAVDNKLEFDGIFCGNDLIAIGAVKSLKEKGLSVPKDISVVGFDDIYVSRLIEPELTTVRQPKYEMGFEAVEMLLKILGGKRVSDTRLVLQPELIIRDSVRQA